MRTIMARKKKVLCKNYWTKELRIKIGKDLVLSSKRGAIPCREALLRLQWEEIRTKEIFHQWKARYPSGQVDQAQLMISILAWLRLETKWTNLWSNLIPESPSTENLVTLIWNPYKVKANCWLTPRMSLNAFSRRNKWGTLRRLTSSLHQGITFHQQGDHPKPRLKRLGKSKR